MTSAIIPEGVTSIGNSVFKGCTALKYIEYNSNCTTTGLFQDQTSLQEVVIGDKVTKLENIFSGCVNLNKITLGAGLTTIKDFIDCLKLDTVICRAKSSPNWSSIMYASFDSCTLVVPEGSIEVYKRNWPWNQFGSIKSSYFDNAIYIEPFSAKSGNTINIDIKLKNIQDIGAYNFNLVLPDGAVLKKNDKDKYIYTLTEDRHEDHSCTINEKGGNTYSVAVLSVSGGEVFGDDGTVITLQAVMDESMKEGVYPVMIQNARYGLPNGQTVDVESTQTLLTINNTMIGDVNGNGGVDIGDAICIVNYIVGKPNAVFVEKAADVNGNGFIGEIGDAVSVVNIIVGKATMKAPRRRINMLDPQ